MAVALGVASVIMMVTSHSVFKTQLICSTSSDSLKRPVGSDVVKN